MAFVIGETIGPYRLVEQLGQGGMATVFKAYHAALDRYVAIKVLHPAFTEDENFLARFQREARLVARLEHANIVPVYDFAEHEGRPYLVMKFIQGKTLKAHMTERRLSRKEIIQVVDVVGSALAYAHRQNILHRDIKPSNVLLSDDGQIYLADFGLARIASGSTGSLTTDMLVGTPQYISPEQAMAKKDLDGRTDIYSFGVMLYEMMVGRVPFSADTPFAVVHDHIYTPLPMPREVNPTISEALERVLLKALAKNPDDRYATADILVEAFQAVFTAAPQEAVTIVERVEAVVPSLVTQRQSQPPAPVQAAPAQPSWFMRNRVALIAGLVLVVLLAGGSFALGRWQNGSPEKTQATPTQATEVAAASAPSPSPEATDPVEVIKPAGDAEFLTLLDVSDTAHEAIDEAMNAWIDDDLRAAVLALQTVKKETGKHIEQSDQVMQYYGEQEVWLLAAIYGVMAFDERPDAFTGERLQALHQYLYKASDDPLAGEYFGKQDNHPMMRVAALRYRLYYSEIVTDHLDRLQQALDTPQEVQRFPELRLLEAEVSVLWDEKQQAADQFQAILDDPNTPQWIKEEARALKEEIK